MVEAERERDAVHDARRRPSTCSPLEPRAPTSMKAVSNEQTITAISTKAVEVQPERPSAPSEPAE